MFSAVFTLLPSLALGALLITFARWALAAQPATVGGRIFYRHDWLSQPPESTGGLHVIGGSPLPPSGETERATDVPWSATARLGLGLQQPRKVVIGRQAQIRMWHRLRSVILLILIVVLGGSALAGVVGLLLFAAGFLVEQAIG